MVGEIPPPHDTPPSEAPKKPGVRVFQCPSCGATLEIRAVGQTITVGCRSCGSTIDTSREDVQLVEKGQLLRRQIYIPFGARGTFGGTPFEMIGVMGRIDQTSNYGWKEYLLYNPYQGFRWLSEAGGQWSFVSPMKAAPTIDDSINFTTGTKPRATFGGRTYTHFQNTDAVVDFVLGEFYWRVKKGDRSKLADYVDPPDLLSCETNGTERIWSRCEYLTSAALQAAFKLTSPLPYASGVAPNQPNPYRESWVGLRKTWLLFSVVLFALLVFHKAASPRKQVFSKSFTYDSKVLEKNVKTEPFEILGGGGNLQLELQSDIHNSFLDVDVDLVNDSTGESHDMQLGSEYWSGYDSDGSWSEGSTHADDLETGVNPGIYHMNLTPTGGTGSSGDPFNVTYTLTATRGVPVVSNFLLAWLLLSLTPLWFYFRAAAFESERWSSSDYAGTDSGNDDD
jgi:hypothetical protein